MSEAPMTTSPSIETATILIVDDNRQNLELMQAYLEDLGCTILTASDGDEAIEIVGQSPPDLMLLDVMMPNVSGFQVCEKLKSQPSTRDIIVIMVTALNEVGDYERAVECGTNDFIAKPVNKHELITRVRSLLELGMLKRRFDQLPLGDRDAAFDRGLQDEGDSMLPPPDSEEDEADS